MTEHTGPGHRDVTLSLTTWDDQGGHVIRSWVICECSALITKIEPLLGPPEWEGAADAATTRAIGNAALHTPGNVYIERGD
jgi:hypothetical protein